MGVPRVAPVPVPVLAPEALGRAVIPSPDTIEQQKLNYAKELDNQLAEGSRSIADNLHHQKLRLRQELQEMGVQYGGHLDQVAAGLRKSIDWQAQQQRMNLTAVTQSLVGGLPELEAGAVNSMQYSQGVDVHLVEGERLIEERVRMQRGRLDQAVWEQKRLHSGQLDRVAVQISLRMDQLAQQQYLQLFQTAQHQK